MPQDIPEITGMRGFASLGVVFFHFFTIAAVVQAAFPHLALPFVVSWDSGVDFFFVLSGFLLTIPFLAGKRPSLHTYFAKRAFRIFPVYYPSILILGLALFYFHRDTVLQIVSSLFFVQSFSPATFNSINGVTWTLIIEEVFYVTLPAFSLLFVNGRWKIALPFCVMLSLDYREIVSVAFPNQLQFYLWQYPAFVGHFAIGATLAALFVSGKMPVGRFRTSWPAIGAVGLLAASQYVIGWKFSIWNNIIPYPGTIFAVEYGVLLFFVLTSPEASLIRTLFTNKVATFIGQISYGTYVWHLPIEIYLFQAGMPALAWVVLSVGLVMGTSLLSYSWLETPMLRVRNEFLTAMNWK